MPVCLSVRLSVCLSLTYAVLTAERNVLQIQSTRVTGCAVLRLKGQGQGQ